MDPNKYLISQVTIVLIINVIFAFGNARWLDEFDSYDTANLKRDYVARYCLASGNNPVVERQEIEHFLNCTKPGLLLQNINTSITSEELYRRNRTVFQTWCSTWQTQRDCESDNQKYVNKCFTDNPSISVGFDLLTGFFESACKKEGKALPDLILYLHMVRQWCWYDERAILSCFDNTNLHYFKRNLKFILPCIQHQLGYCGNNRNQSREVLKSIVKEVEAGYSSSRYVYLINVEPSEISNETIPYAAQLPNNKCPNATFAYIAFFVLLALVLITLGALVSVKVRSLNLPCLQKRNALVENDGNTVEL